MTEYSVTKHASDGRPPFRYQATLIEQRPDWIVVDADWPLPEVHAGPVSFKPGDRLIEFFSTADYFNAFLIYRNGSDFAGWYCNITMPTEVDGDEIHWHDLYLDIIVDTGGKIHIKDEDELEESGLAQSNPDLYQTILDAKLRLIELIEQNGYPFASADRGDRL
ncbi:DUF402 domain-containing protein [soil metagenome]